MKGTGIIVVFRKEIRDLLRDKRTVIIGIIIPIILFPLIFSIMNINVKKNKLLIKESLKVSVAGKDNSLQRFLKSRKNLRIIPSENPRRDLAAGRIYAAVIIPDDFNARIKSQRSIEIRIIVDNTSQISIMAYDTIRSLIEGYSKEIVQRRFATTGMDRTLLKPLSVVKEMTLSESEGAGKMMLSLLLPLLLLIFSATSPSAIAADLCAGEKERGTLEPLLSTPIGRLNLLAGKFLAITAMGIIGVIAFMAGLFISYMTSPDFFGAENLSFTMHAPELILMAFYTVMLTMIFGAIELAISIYAKSSKEAQTYFLPVFIISIATGYGTFMIDIKNIDPRYLHIPLINISIIIKKLVIGHYATIDLVFTFLWALVYIVVAFFFSRIMFEKENVIFRS
jgi:sodium transport system permease protein